MTVASAAFIGLRPALPEPLKMQSDMSLPRRLLADCSPSTHLMPSTMLDLPEPFGPTTTVMPAGNSKRVLSAKLLKPKSSSALSMTRRCEPVCGRTGLVYQESLRLAGGKSPQISRAEPDVVNLDG